MPERMGRIKRIQDILKTGKWKPSSTDSSIDGLLLVLGIDSRFNEGCTKMFQWLCNGNNLLQEGLKKGQDETDCQEEEIEDVVVLITRDSVILYCNPLNLKLLLPYFATVPNLSLHCLSPELFQDEESVEEYKMKEFIKFTSPYNIIGIPFFQVHDPSHSFDPMKLEREWALIHSHAAEELGRHGFFTLQHEVVEISPFLEAVYNELDPYSFKDLVSKPLTGFMKQWESLCAVLDSSSDDIASLTEEQLSEPFRFYVKHEQFQRAPSSQISRMSGVWVGCNSASMDREQPELPVVPVRVGSSGLEHDSALHMVCSLTDSKGCLSVQRSYFLWQTNPLKPYSANPDIRFIQQLYSCLVAAVYSAIQSFVRSQNPSEVHQRVVNVLKKQSTKKGLSLSSDFWDVSDNLHAVLQASDLGGSPVTLRVREWTPLVVKQLSVTLKNIPSISRPGQSLGCLAFGESFTDSVIQVENGWETECFVLTSDIPPILSWPGSKPDVMYQLETKKKLADKELATAEWGELVADIGLVYLTVPHELRAPCMVSVRAHLYQRAFLVENTHFRSVVLPLDQVTTMLFYDGGLPDSLAILTLEHSPALSHSLPPELLGSANTILMLFPPHLTTKRALYQEVVPFMHSLGDLFKTPEALPERLEYIYDELRDSLLPTDQLQTHPHTIPKRAASRLQSFIKHFEVAHSLRGKGPINSIALQHITFPETARSTAKPGNKLVVTVLTGIPGSHKDHVCSTLLSLERPDFRWIVLQQSFENTSDFDPKSLQDSLSTIVASAKKKGIHRRSLSGVRRSRILLVTPWFVDVQEILLAISTHPDTTVRNMVTIGSVTSCINSLNSFMYDRTPFPKLLENCACGLVNNVVFTGLPSHPRHAELFKEVQYLVRCCNPQTTFVSAPAGVFTANSDIELVLSEDAWSSRGEVLRERVIRFHGWEQGETSTAPPQPKFDLICLKFKVPLDKDILESNLKALQPVLHVDELSQHEGGLVYHIRANIIIQGPSKLEVYFTRQSGYLKMSEAEPGPEELQQSAVVFVGQGLKEAALKSWLEDCRGKDTRRLPLKTKETLTTEELADVKAKCKQSSLPPGHYYTGVYYVNFEGEKFSEHPLMEQYTEEYLAQHNTAIEAHNATIVENMFP